LVVKAGLDALLTPELTLVSEIADEVSTAAAPFALQVALLGGKSAKTTDPAGLPTVPVTVAESWIAVPTTPPADGVVLIAEVQLLGAGRVAVYCWSIPVVLPAPL
jgi:hypothetical protein